MDDSPAMREILRRMLHCDSSVSWQIVEAADATELLTAVTLQPVDVVLLDVQMPGIDGFAACRLLRERDRELPVMFVTSEAALQSFHKGRSAGGDSYIVKPFTAAALHAALHVLTTVKRRPRTIS